MDSPGSRPAEGAQVAPPADRLVLYSRARSSWKSVHSSESNELPASREQRDDRKGGKPAGADTVPTVRTACPATKHEKAPEEPARRGTATKARLPFLFAGVHKTYSTFQDWKNHLHTTHGQCLGDDDPLDREEYAAGFKLDRWERFHHIEGDEDDRAYQRIATLRKHYGPYQGGVKGEPPGAPSTIRIPHTKGTTPDREVVPAESEFAGSDQDGSDQEEGEITQTEGEGVRDVNADETQGLGLGV